MEIDYKTMFEQTLKQLNDAYSMHEEMCRCATNLKENEHKANIAANHMFEMTLGEQTALMRAANLYTEIAAKLCEKYGWDEPTEEETDDEDN